MWIAEKVLVFASRIPQKATHYPIVYSPLYIQKPNLTTTNTKSHKNNVDLSKYNTSKEKNI